MKTILIHRSTTNINSKSSNSATPELHPCIKISKIKSSPCSKNGNPVVLDFGLPDKGLVDKPIKKRRHKKRAKKRKRKVHEIS